MLKAIELHTLNGWNVWYMNYISVKLFLWERISWGLRKFSPDKYRGRGASSIRGQGRRPSGQSQGSRQKWLELWWAGHQGDLQTKCVPWKIILNDKRHRGGDQIGAEWEGSLTLKSILWWSGESGGAWAGVTDRQPRRDRAQPLLCWKRMTIPSPPCTDAGCAVVSPGGHPRVWRGPLRRQKPPVPSHVVCILPEVLALVCLKINIPKGCWLVAVSISTAFLRVIRNILENVLGCKLPWWWFSLPVVSDSCNPMDCSPPGSSSVHGISQARILEWVAISFSRGSSWPRDQTCVGCIAGQFFTTEIIIRSSVNPTSLCLCLLALLLHSSRDGVSFSTLLNVGWPWALLWPKNVTEVTLCEFRSWDHRGLQPLPWSSGSPGTKLCCSPG